MADCTLCLLYCTSLKLSALLVFVVFRALLTIITSCLLIHSVNADQPDTVKASSLVELSPISVTSEKDELVDIQIVGHQQRIDRDIFSNTYLPLDELLEQQAGIDIQTVGGNGQYSSPTIRGSSGKQVLVFWDGLLINDLNGGSADIGSLSLSSAGNIDIYRGMSPIELSPTAVGGVINIQSHDLPDNSGEAGITYGSFQTQELYASHLFSNIKSSLFLNLNYFYSDNDFEYLENSPVSSPNKPATEKRKNNGVNNQSFLAKAHHNLTNSVRVDASAQIQNGRREISSRINTSANKAYIDQDAYRLQSTLSYKHKVWGKSSIRFSHTNNIELYNDEKSTVGLGAQYNRYTTDKDGISLQHNAKFSRFSIVTSAGIEKETVSTEFPRENITTESCLQSGKCETEFIRTSSHLGTRFNIGLSENLTLMQQISIFQYSDDNNSKDPEFDFTNIYKATTFDTGADYKFNNGMSIYLKTGKQVRPPSSNELFGDRGTTKGNPSLIAEESTYYEVGFSAIHSNITVDTSIYQRSLLNAIAPSSDSRGIISFENIAETQHSGIELTSSIDWSKNWRSNINLTLQDNVIIDHANNSFIDNQVGDYSRFHSYLSTGWYGEKLSILGSRSYQTGGYYNSLNSLPRDAKDVWNLSVTWQEIDWLISLEAKNLTDDRSRDYPSIPGPGRQYYLKFIYNW